jgi:hypothetical protein
MKLDGYYKDYEDESIHTCSDCGKEYTWQWTTKHVGMCFTCQHWYSWYACHLTNPTRTFVVKGTAFTHVDYEEGCTRGGGHGGSEFVIQCFDGRTVISRNLWCQGDVDEHWLKALPDTAEFIWPNTHRCQLEREVWRTHA